MHILYFELKYQYMFVVAIFIIRLIYNCYIFNIEIDTRWYNQKKKKMGEN